MRSAEERLNQWLWDHGHAGRSAAVGSIVYDTMGRITFIGRDKLNGEYWVEFYPVDVEHDLGSGAGRMVKIVFKEDLESKEKEERKVKPFVCPNCNKEVLEFPVSVLDEKGAGIWFCSTECMHEYVNKENKKEDQKRPQTREHILQKHHKKRFGFGPYSPTHDQWILDAMDEWKSEGVKNERPDEHFDVILDRVMHNIPPFFKRHIEENKSRTKKEILSELFKPYVEKLSNIEKLLEFSGSLTTKGWEIVEQAMDEWHKECLPNDWELNKENIKVNYPRHDLIVGFEAGVKWCRDFKRKGNILCVGCGKNITDETQFRTNNRVDMAFCDPVCEMEYLKKVYPEGN